jgi:hypothetical protein
VLLVLCAIATAISIRRLMILSGSAPGNVPELARLDELFANRLMLTSAHIVTGLTFALALPVQLSARVRSSYPALHRRLGRFLLVSGVLVGISAYGMVAVPIGGAVEMSATIFYATAFVGALVTAWWHIRHRDALRHREWMLRAVAILLGIATTRPVMALFFATRPLTHLTPSQFFGVAFWIGFTSTLMAAEWYIRATRPALAALQHAPSPTVR